MTTTQDCQIIAIPKIHDAKGNLSVIEHQTIPFEIKRVFYLYDVPSHAERQGNAHQTLQKVLIALNGSFEVVTKDGAAEKVFTLNKPNEALFIPHGIWREMRNFSSGAVCLVIASENFDEGDYIRSFDAFVSFKNRIS